MRLAPSMSHAVEIHGGKSQPRSHKFKERNVNSIGLPILLAGMMIPTAPFLEGERGTADSLTLTGEARSHSRGNPPRSVAKNLWCRGACVC